MKTLTKPAKEAVFRVSVAQPADLPEVRAAGGTSDDAPRWPAEAWGHFVGQGASGARAAVLLLGRDQAGRLCGWLAGAAVAGGAELEFVWVYPPERGRGLGRLLLERWFEWAESQGAMEIFLEVRVSNEGAIALYRSVGFADAGRRRGYYRKPVEDAIVMRVGLPREH